MQYYINKHRHACGVDLHGKNLYLCMLDPDRKILLHRRVPCDADRLLTELKPFCADHDFPFVLGHSSLCQAPFLEALKGLMPMVFADLKRSATYTVKDIFELPSASRTSVLIS